MPWTAATALAFLQRKVYDPGHCPYFGVLGLPNNGGQGGWIL